MTLIQNLLNFSTENRSVEETLGIDLPEAISFDVFSKQISDSNRIDTIAARADYEYDVTFGLDLEIERASLGIFDIEYPIVTNLNLPDFVEGGRVFTVGTDNDFNVQSASITGESLNFGELGLNLTFESDGASLSDISFGNVLGVELFPLDGSLSFNSIPEQSARLITIDLGGVRDVEIADGVDFVAKSPSGEEKSSAPVNGPPGTLPSLSVDIEEALVSIEINPLEILDDFGPLRALDVLTEDFGPLEFFVGGREFEAEFEYTLISPSVAGGYGLVQDFSFDPASIRATYRIGDQEFSGNIGDSFDFVAPNDTFAPLKGQVTYEFGGAVDIDYALAPIGTLGVEVLSASGTIMQKGGDGISARLGPVFDASVSGSTDFAKVDLFDPIRVELPNGFFEPVVVDFEIPQAPSGGQDIAFVIDTTSSMRDDIDAVKSRVTELIDAIFGPDGNLANARIGVTGYKDPGQTTTILPFTNQSNIEDRKSAAISAINTITISGGGDFPEGVYSGLLHALSGQLGDWREDATARRVILFGDAPPKDFELADEVALLAANLNADVDVTIGAFSSEMVENSIYKSTINATFAAEDGLAVTVPVEIFTVVVGSEASARSSFADIADETGGRAFTAADASEVVDVLIGAVSDTGTEIIGTDGNDRLDGTAGDDSITALGGNDVINAGAGNDTILARFGDDRVFGEEGDDIIRGGNDDDLVVGGPGNDNIRGGNGTDILEGGLGIDVLIGGEGRDTLRGTAAELNGDTVEEFELADRVVVVGALASALDVERVGDDVEVGIDTNNDGTFDTQLTFEALSTDDFLIEPDPGNNWTVVRLDDGRGSGDTTDDASPSTLVGTAANDVLGSDLGSFVMRGGAGDDIYTVDDDNDVVVENANGGFDRVNLFLDARNFETPPHVEQLILQAGVITATPASTGTKLAGLDDDNVFFSGAGTDFYDGNGGRDTLTYENAVSGVEASLLKPTAFNTGGAGTDKIDDIEILIGSEFDDVLVGGQGVPNEIFGGAGNDIIVGFAGPDQITGGPGNDIFAYNRLEFRDSLIGDGEDTIIDFDVGTDQIDLTRLRINEDDLDFSAGRLEADVDGNDVPDFAINFANNVRITAEDVLV